MNILPKPYKIEVAEGSFAFRADGKVAADLPVIASLFGGADASSPVKFSKGETEWDYVLKITPKGVSALAKDDEGLFHAAVTLLQLTGARWRRIYPRARCMTNRATPTARA